MKMKSIILFGCSILAIIMLAANASAADQIDTSNIYIMAYYRAGPSADLSQAIQEFDYVRESTGQYVEGQLEIWHNFPNGRDTGASTDFEIRDGVFTDIPFSTTVNVRVKSDGWIVAWLTNEQNLSDIVFWNRVADYNLVPLDTTLGQAIWRISNRLNANYDKNGVKYYSYKYPDANRLLIGGAKTISNAASYSFLIPSEITLYEADFLWVSYLEDTGNYYNYGLIKLDGLDIYNKNTSNTFKDLYEYTRYSYHIDIDIARDMKHSIYMKTSTLGSNGLIFLKSAVALLYKSG
ncbi:MAG: hypothetical protein V1718_02955 [archaeon]